MYLPSNLVTEAPISSTQINSLAETTTEFETDDGSYHAKFLMIYGFMAMLFILAVYAAIRGDIMWYIYHNVLIRMLHTLYDIVGLGDMYSDTESVDYHFRFVPPGVGAMSPAFGSPAPGSPVPETRQNVPTTEETAPKKVKNKKNKKKKQKPVWQTGVHQARPAESAPFVTPVQPVSVTIPEASSTAASEEIILKVA